MTSPRLSTTPLRRVADLLFRHQLQLRWRGGPQLALVDRQAAAGPSPEAVARSRAQAELQRMRADLAAALDAIPGLRDELRALAFVEHALATQGLAALDQVMLAVLARALDEFESLVSNWSPPGLAALRSRMSVAVQARAQREDVFEDGQIPVSQPVSRRRAPVSEPVD